MVTLATGVSGRGEASFLDTSAAGPGFVGIYITDYDPVLLDASFRYNPEWRTFGHVSVCLEETVLAEWWSNYVFQVSKSIAMPPHPLLTELGFADYFNPAINNFEVPYVIKWQFRPSVIATITYIT